MKQCRECNGKGYIERSLIVDKGFRIVKVYCETCKGIGYVTSKTDWSEVKWDDWSEVK